MGIVYVAEHTLIGKKVAVKTVRPELVEHQGVAERFINEARAVNTIGDEHIVDIFDAGQTPDGALYCVMELLIGESLQDFMKRSGRVSLETAVHIALQIARALHACHQKQIIHRDLKPGNIFIVQRGGGPFVKILDFGIAKLIGQSSSATHSNAIIGTPFYMAPEQCRGTKDLDHRIDVYALGIILYELCTGTLPFEGDSAGDVIIKQATELPEDPCRRSPELPEWLCLVILRALEKNRDARFRDMAAFAAALETHAMPANYTPPSGNPLPSMQAFTTPGGSVRGAPTQSIHVTPLEYQAQQAKGTFEPAVTAGPTGSGARRSTPGAAQSGTQLDAKPRVLPKVLIALAAILVVGLVIVVRRYVASPIEAARSAQPAASGAPPSAPSVDTPPSTVSVTPVDTAAARTATPAPSPVVPASATEATPPVATSKSRPVGGKRPPANKASEPVVTPVEPGPPRPKTANPHDSLLPPAESMLPE